MAAALPLPKQWQKCLQVKPYPVPDRHTPVIVGPPDLLPPIPPKEKVKKHRTKQNRLSEPLPPLLLHSTRPGLVLLLYSLLPFPCHRCIWERVLGQLAFASPSAWGRGWPPSLGCLLGLLLHWAHICLESC